MKFTTNIELICLKFTDNQFERYVCGPSKIAKNQTKQINIKLQTSSSVFLILCVNTNFKNNKNTILQISRSYKCFFKFNEVRNRWVRYSRF